jgi:hypothetical protein
MIFHVLIGANIKFTVFWDVTPCSFVEIVFYLEDEIKCFPLIR